MMEEDVLAQVAVYYYVLVCFCFLVLQDQMKPLTEANPFGFQKEKLDTNKATTNATAAKQHSTQNPKD
jgi:hypothetical protein